VIVECAVYENGSRRQGDLALHDACAAAQAPGAFAWIDLYEPTHDEIERLRHEFGLHPLAIEDALELHQRPKLEVFDRILFIALKTVAYDDETEALRFGEVMVFCGERFVITVRHGEAHDLESVKARFRDEPERLRHGAAGILHAVIDEVVDGYWPVVSALQEDVDQVEESLFSPEGDLESTRRIYSLGREVIELSRAVQPLVDPVRSLAGDAPQIAPELRSYFRDIADHVERVDAWVGSQRELLSNLLQANLTQVSIVQNNDMRKISAWVAIAAVPTVVGGIYGMNFEHMPELGWTFGYPLALAVIAAVCVLLWWRFKEADWL
jgi:magnesium transporter